MKLFFKLKHRKIQQQKLNSHLTPIWKNFIYKMEKTRRTLLYLQKVKTNFHQYKKNISENNEKVSKAIENILQVRLKTRILK